MKLLDLINHMPITDKKAIILRQDAIDYPEIGEMDAFIYLRAALLQVECPSCIGHGARSSKGCRYCGGLSKVDYHLVTHPMNVYSTAIRMDGSPA